MTTRTRIILVLIIPLGLFFYFLSKLNFSDFKKLLTQASLMWIVLGSFFFLLQLMMRAARYMLILDIKVGSLKKLCGVIGVYSMLKFVLPGAPGEMSILYLLKKALNVDFSKGTSSFFILRSIDIFLFSSFFIIIYISFYDLFSTSTVMNIAFKFMLILVAILFAVCIFLFNATRFASLPLRLSFLQRSKLAEKIKKFLINFTCDFRNMISARSLISLVGTTILLWAFLYLMFVAAVRALHINLSIFEILFVFAYLI